MNRLLVMVAAAAAARGEDLRNLEFMSGCWSVQMGRVTIEEQWNRPAGGIMQGVSRTLKDGKAVFHEFIRLEQRGDDVVYTPRIGDGSKPVPFRLIRLTAGEAVFENPEHDFPQRVIYRKAPVGLPARIEGTKNGKARSEDFPYQRIACP